VGGISRKNNVPHFLNKLQQEKSEWYELYQPKDALNKLQNKFQHDMWKKN
jgi:hypothetical protein